jgi:hypothetical protein
MALGLLVANMIYGYILKKQVADLLRMVFEEQRGG